MRLKGFHASASLQKPFIETERLTEICLVRSFASSDRNNKTDEIMIIFPVRYFVHAERRDKWNTP